MHCLMSINIDLGTWIQVQGNQLCHFQRCTPFKRSTLKGKNLLLWEQILFFESRPHFEGASSAIEAYRTSQKFSPIVKISYKHGAVGWLVVLLFYVHSKHLRSCRDGQLT